MGRCESCGAQVDAGALECRHCGMPVAFAVSAPLAPAETSAAESTDGHRPSGYGAYSPVIGGGGEQYHSNGSGEVAPQQAVGVAQPRTAGFADWQAAVDGEEPESVSVPVPVPDGDAAHALYPGYLRQPMEATEAQPQNGGSANTPDAVAPSDLRAVSAYGLRYQETSVRSDKIQENATTLEPAEEQVKGSMTMTTAATSVARVLVRSVAEGSTEQEREFALDGRTVTVGRSPACDIALEGDQLASRRHALLRAEGDRYTLVDLGSSNGSFINDVEIQEPTVLHDGDRITIGEHDLLFRTDPASPSASVAGVKLDGEQASAQPQGETSPHVAIVSVIDEQDDWAKQPQAQQEQQEPPVSYAPPAPQIGDAFSAPPAQPAPQPTSQAPAASQGGMITPITPPMPPATAGADALDKIRAQLTDASLALAQQSEAEARLADQRRATVEEISARLGDLLAQEQSVAMPSSADVEALAQVARETAANPRHLDALSALAARASDLAQALEAQKQWLAKRADLLDTLNALRAKLNQLG